MPTGRLLGALSGWVDAAIALYPLLGQLAHYMRALSARGCVLHFGLSCAIHAHVVFVAHD